MVMGLELLFMFSPFAVVLFGLLSERYKDREAQRGCSDHLQRIQPLLGVCNYTLIWQASPT